MDATITGRYTPSVKVSVTDTSAFLPPSVTTTGAGAIVLGILVTVETYPVRIRFGADPDIATPNGHLIPVGAMLRILGQSNIATMKVVNANAGQNAVLQITPEG
jgi:hypothetical protein